MLFRGTEVLEDIVIVEDGHYNAPERRIAPITKITKTYIEVEGRKYSTKTGSVMQAGVGVGQHDWSNSSLCFIEQAGNKYFRIWGAGNYVLDRNTLKSIAAPMDVCLKGGAAIAAWIDQKMAE